MGKTMKREKEGERTELDDIGDKDLGHACYDRCEVWIDVLVVKVAV
jgi:hypothetical protein